MTISLRDWLRVIPEGPANALGQLAAMSIRGIDPHTGTEVLLEKSFQYWPESFTFSREGGWAPREIPGGPGPIQQWSGNGEASLSFDVVMTQVYAPGTYDRLRPPQDPRHVDVAAGLAYFQAYMAPMSAGTRALDGIPVGAPSGTYYRDPPTCELYIPKLGLGHSSAPNVFVCVMKRCEIVIKKLWPDGTIKSASVSLEFADQPIRQRGRVEYVDFDTLRGMGRDYNPVRKAR